MVERDSTTLHSDDLRDIQGLILLDYNMPLVRHFLLKVERAQEALRFLGALASESALAGLRITTAADKSAESCLNIGLTYAGLQALGLPATALDSFASTPSFVAGAAARAWKVGDNDENAPERWWTDKEKTRPKSSDIHLLLSLYAQYPQEKNNLGSNRSSDPARKSILDTKATRLKERLRNSLSVVWETDREELYDRNDPQSERPGKLIHFDYKDGISQPQIAGAPPAGTAVYPGQETVLPRAFLFGYASQWTSFRYPVPRPEQFGRNGSFAVFRVMKQEVDKFAQCPRKTAQRDRISEEEVAARLCGRKPNGDPLMETRSTHINDFDYTSDPKGEVCPFHSHIRRTNPRGEKIAGADTHQHPIIRGGMPYGPPYDPKNPDAEERGLLGLFIGVSIEDRFEFIMQNWMNKGGFRQGLPTKSVDPFHPFIMTRGSAYCFLPSINALKYIAALPSV